MSVISCAIVEDDLITLRMIEAMAEKTTLLDVRGTFTSPLDAVHWLANHQVELLFLDMEMPEMTGLELLQALVYKPEVIVISGNRSFAVDAFEFALVDFILKPIKDYSRFLKSVNKVIEKRKTISSESDEILYVKIGSNLIKIIIDDISYIKASGDYIRIHIGDTFHTVYSTLKKICTKLSGNKFVRVHRSFVVNLSKITNIDATNLAVNKKTIPISSSYKEELLSKIKVL